MATAGRAVLFSGLTVMIGLLGLTDVHVRGAALDGHRRGDRRGAVGAGRRDAAAGDAGRAGPRIDALRGAAAAASTRRRGLLARRRRAGDGPIRAACWSPLWRCWWRSGCRSCTSSSAHRTPRSCRRRAVAAGLRPAADGVRRGRDLADPDRRDGAGLDLRAAPPDRPQRVRVAASGADPRVERVDSIVSLDPRLTLEQHLLVYSDPQRIADPYARALAAETTRDRFTLVRVVSRAARPLTVAKSLVLAIAQRPHRRRSRLPGGRRHGRRHRLRGRAVQRVSARAGADCAWRRTWCCCSCSGRWCCR